jgi:hypothetical protein
MIKSVVKVVGFKKINGTYVLVVSQKKVIRMLAYLCTELDNPEDIVIGDYYELGKLKVQTEKVDTMFGVQEAGLFYKCELVHQSTGQVHDFTYITSSRI